MEFYARKTYRRTQPTQRGCFNFLGLLTVGWSSRNFSRMAAVCEFGDRRPSSQLRSDGKWHENNIALGRQRLCVETVRLVCAKR